MNPEVEAHVNELMSQFNILQAEIRAGTEGINALNMVCAVSNGMAAMKACLARTKRLRDYGEMQMRSAQLARRLADLLEPELEQIIERGFE